jgi:hypothetical protein
MIKQPFNKLHTHLCLALIVIPIFIQSCSDNDVPKAENEEEIITDVTLTFQPMTGDSAVLATASDPDGEGPADLIIDSNITLAANTTYTLMISLTNSVEGESITEEIEEEADEHLFLFGWTNEVFSNPAGDGNIDNRGDLINYSDSDDNGLPVGLETGWTTGNEGSGTFRVVLKHQPNIKSPTSSISDGSSDLDLTWNILIID